MKAMYEAMFAKGLDMGDPDVVTGVLTANGFDAAAFAALRERVLACAKCPHLASSRQTVVFGVGNPDAQLMFVGEAPGVDEDRQGEPFVGAAGQLLDKIIVATGLTRPSVYIANVLKCRPDTPGQSYGNRPPRLDEMGTCLPYLLEQIQLIQPRVIVALGVAVMLMYFVLVVQFGSFLDPLAILLSLPLSLIGVMLALLLWRSTLNVFSMIGLILLVGLAIKNGILLVDRTNHNREEGLSVHDALLEAGPARLRAILMTSVTIAIALLPTAFQLGEGSELRAPLAATVIGGVISSTLLTLVFVPVMYTLMYALRLRSGQAIGWMWHAVTGPAAPDGPADRERTGSAAADVASIEK